MPFLRGSRRPKGECLSLREAGAAGGGGSKGAWGRAHFEKAKAFEKTWGIESVAVHGLLGRWMKRQDQLEPNDVLVVNDVKRLSQSRRTGFDGGSAMKAKLVLVDETGFTTIEGEDVGINAAHWRRLEAPADNFAAEATG